MSDENSQLLFLQWKRDALTLRGSVHLPPGEQPVPWVIFCHGFTGHRIGPGYLYVRMARELAAAGIASLRFDFSGSGESDGTFAAQSISTMREDLLSAHACIHERFSPRRCILAGHSLGGCICALDASACNADGLILMAPVAFPTDHVKGYQDVLRGGANDRGMYEVGPHELTMKFLDELVGAHPLDALSEYHNPLLILHGQDDERISLAEVLAYEDTARRNGSAVTMHTLAGADHRFTSVACRVNLVDITTRWIKEYFQ